LTRPVHPGRREVTGAVLGNGTILRPAPTMDATANLTAGAFAANVLPIVHCIEAAAAPLRGL
jgi:hypothetical protein